MVTVSQSRDYWEEERRVSLLAPTQEILTRPSHWGRVISVNPGQGYPSVPESDAAPWPPTAYFTSVNPGRLLSFCNLLWLISPHKFITVLKSDGRNWKQQVFRLPIAVGVTTLSRVMLGGVLLESSVIRGENMHSVMKLVRVWPHAVPQRNYLGL